MQLNGLPCIVRMNLRVNCTEYIERFSKQMCRGNVFAHVLPNGQKTVAFLKGHRDIFEVWLQLLEATPMLISFDPGVELD